MYGTRFKGPTEAPIGAQPRQTNALSVIYLRSEGADHKACGGSFLKQNTCAGQIDSAHVGQLMTRKNGLRPWQYDQSRKHKMKGTTMSKAASAITLLLVCVLPAMAQKAPPAIDVTQLDIAGVKLGMTTAQAVAATLTGLKVNKSEIKFDRFPAPNLVTRTKEPQYFSVDKDREKLVVHLAPTIPHDSKNPMRVAMIAYEMTWTQANAKSMREAALRKFGPPSNGTIAVMSEWCAAPSVVSTEGCSDVRNREPVLTFHGTKLELLDPRYRNAYNEFVEKANSAAPSF